MRKEIYKELVTRFTRELEQRLPQFQRGGVERDAGDIPIWAWELAPKVTFFVLLNVADNDDDFAIEVGWSDDGKYPWRSRGFRFTQLDAPTTRERLSFLWVTGKREYRWSIVPRESADTYLAKMAARRRGEKVSLRPPPAEEALPRVAPLVEDAVQKLIDYGLPLFRRVVEQRGLTWPLPDESPSPSSL
jgi:hypothetical protein